MRLFGRQSRIGSLRKAAMGIVTGRVRLETKKKKQGGETDTASRWTQPEVMPNGGSGVGFHGLETGREFYWVGLRKHQNPTHQGDTESP